MISYQHTVQYYETDRMGITHHSNYIRWMEEARVELLVRMGWNLERLEAMGLFIPVVALDCQYKTPTSFADRVDIRVRLVRCGGVRIVLAYEMRREDGALVCTGRTEHCLLDGEGNIVRLQRECPGFYAAMQDLLKEQEAEKEG